MRNAELFKGAHELPDDDRHDPHDAETAEPCRGCNSIHCAGECPEYHQWLAVAYLDWDAAHGDDADARP